MATPAIEPKLASECMDRPSKAFLSKRANIPHIGASHGPNPPVPDETGKIGAGLGFPINNYSTPAQLGLADVASRQVWPMARPVCHKRGSSDELASPRAHRPDVEHTNPQVTAGGSDGPTPHGGILAVYGGEEVKGKVSQRTTHRLTNDLTATMQDKSTPIEPKPEELWVLYRESDSDARLGIAEVDAVLDDGTYRLTLLYDTTGVVETPTQMEGQPKSIFHAKLPDYDEWTEQYEELLDYTRRNITPWELADLLDGEPAYDTNGERGYDALRFFVLNGISESITEWSVHQGHGPSRYASAVERRLEDAPKHLIEDILSSEQDRWDSGVELSEDAASKLVEILLLRKKHLGDEVESDISLIVNEYDLDYDEYREEA